MVNVIDAAGATLTKSYTITVNPVLNTTPATLPVDDVGVPYNQVITLSNGAAPYTALTVTGFNAGGTGLALPAINVGGGTISFSTTPTAAGTVTFTVNATDSAGGTLSKNYTVTVNPALTIAPAALLGGDPAVPYTQVITVANGGTTTRP